MPFNFPIRRNVQANADGSWVLPNVSAWVKK
jgi:hypothetical protein